MSYNLAIVEGRVGKDPEIRSTTTGKKVVSFSLASDVGYGDKQSTLWDAIIAWGDQADFIEKFIKKGSAIRIVGERQSRKWTDKNGQEKTVVEINAFKISFAEKASKPQQETRAVASPQTRVQTAPPVRVAQSDILADTEINEDDLPF